MAGTLTWRGASSLALWLLLTPIAVGGTVIYVDDSATGSNDGSTWCDAFLYLQDALAAAEASGGTITEIRVAQGTYKPDQGANQTSGDRTASFNLIDGVAIRGGFGGCGAPIPDNRDIEVYETILSGDLNGDDAPNVSDCCRPTDDGGCSNSECESAVCAIDPSCCSVWDDSCSFFSGNLCQTLCGGTDENASHVITLAPSFSSSIDGLSIVRGNGDSIEGDFQGGGFLGLANSSVSITDCSFWLNRGQQGGAIRSLGPMEIRNSTFGLNWGASGGAVSSERTLTLDGCSFVNNLSVGNGGAVQMTGLPGGAYRCAFVGNRSRYVGGAVHVGGATKILQQCVFSGNRCGGSGAAVYGGGEIALDMCAFTGNVAGSGTIDINGAPLSVINSTLFGNRGGGMRSNHNPLIANSIFWKNVDEFGTSESAQIILVSGSPILRYNTVEGWTGAYGGVGNVGDDPLFVGGPSGMWTSDGTYDESNGATTLSDVAASWQSSEWVGKFLNPDMSQYLQSYIVANTATTMTVLGDFASLGVAGATYKINDYRLSSGSPCIDAADNTAVPADELDLDGDGDATEPTPFDLDGDPRFRDDPTTPDTGLGTPPIVDMGAYEYQRGCLADPDCDNLNPCDGVESCVSNVCEPGTPIVCDDGQPCNGTEVCNANGTCDTVFDTDCNSNSIEDVCDIIGGSPDANANGIPDECEPGACCAPDGSCSETAQAECVFAWSVGNDCNPNPCAFLTAVEVLGCRYFSVTPNPSADPDLSLAIRVERQDLTCPVKYVVLDSGWGRLVDTPGYLPADQWGTVIVADRETVPLATFTIQTQTDDGLSDPVNFTLRKWGDVVSPFGGPTQPNFGDISALVDCFRGASGSAPLGACDLQPIVPDAVADFADISKGVDAFRGLPYPFTAAGQCP